MMENREMDIEEQQTDEEEALAESVGRSSAMMSVLVMISRVTGFFRTWAQAYAVGVTMLASCYTTSRICSMSLSWAACSSRHSCLST